MQTLILVCCFAVLVGTLYIFHKIRKIHLMLFDVARDAQDAARESGALFSQLQALGELQSLLRLSEAMPPLRGWVGSPDFLLQVAQHVLGRKPVHVLECSSGASTLVIARCLQLLGRGHVYSLEHEPGFAQKTRELLASHGVAAYATVIDAPLVAAEGHGPWYSTDGLPQLPEGFGLLVVDGPPSAVGPLARYPAMPRLRKYLSGDFSVYVDDADREDEKAMVARWLREFPELRAESLVAEKGLVKLTLRSPV